MIVATAGHVDHGKTLLVKALTGVDTDRLPEEKRRGLTIDLGFAYLPVDDGEPIGFIDVPGHERFVHNMLSGVTGIDLGLLVVAADDGPMPQTFEHLAILDLIGVRRGALALTKVDRVPRQRVVEVQQQMVSLLSGTTLENSAVFPVSVVANTGVDALKRHLFDTARECVARATNRNFRMTVDRSFTQVGAGLVVTGTVVSGALRMGEHVRILPSGLTAKVRSIHAQNLPAERCHAGQRCGLNLVGPGLRRDLVSRGGWVVNGRTPITVQKLDARLRVRSSEKRTLEHWTPVHVHAGAMDLNGRVAILGESEIVPGATGLVQLTLDQPACMLHGDAFVIRDQSAQRTIGGGRVIDIFPPSRNRAAVDRVKYLRAMEIESDDTALTTLLALTPYGLRLDRFAANRNLTEQETAELLTRIEVKLVTGPSGTLAFTLSQWANLKQILIDALKSRHQAAPYATSASEQRIFLDYGVRLPSDAAAAVTAELLREGAIVRDASGLRLRSHQLRLSAADSGTWKTVATILRESPMRPPNVRELAGMLREDPKKVESFLLRASRITLVIRLSDNRFILPESLQRLGEITQELATTSVNRTVTAAALRDRIGGGRKVAIEILEYFDRIKFTRRIGDEHAVIGERVCYPSSE